MGLDMIRTTTREIRVISQKIRELRQWLRSLFRGRGMLLMTENSNRFSAQNGSKGL